LDNVWDAGYNATITITNTSDSIIENWCLTFPLNETISDIWNAAISETHDDFYVIKNAGWNQDIAVGKSVSFGITVYEPFSEYPEYYSILGNEVETKSEDYTVDYKITEDWGDGYKAAVTITNNKATAIEDWRLTFSYGDNLITQMWNAVILNNTDGTYQLGCETYNQNIAPGESITFGFMVEPGCSGKLMENVVLREYVATGDNAGEDADDGTEDDNQDGDKTENVAIIFGTLGEDGSQELYLSMMASVEIKRYEIYMSIDNGNFEMVAETEESEYAYDIISGCSNMEIYAVGYGQNDEAIETNHIFVEKTNGVYAVMLPDTDGDGLEDVYEIYYGSDVNLVDTDGDKLNDYYGVYVSSTYPTLKDSDENGVMDGDEDYDEDGVTILEECANGTDPLNPDSDYDNLVDGDEINVYGTDPLVADCDDDGLVDGDEIAVGTEPLNPDTDGDGILDGDERFQQTYSHQVENEDCAVTEVSVTLEGTGNLQSTTCIESVMNKDALCTGVVGLVGEPFEIETESEFDEATITFKIDKDKLDETVDFDNLMFLWYDEESGEFVELETTTNESLGWATVETNHFSKYMIVDKEKWYAAWAKELNYGIGSDTDYDEYYTDLVIEATDLICSIDPISYSYEKKDNIPTSIPDCYRVGLARNYVKNMRENEMVNLSYFSYSEYYSSGFSNDKDYLDSKISLIPKYSYGVNDIGSILYASALDFPDEIRYDDKVKKRIILVTTPHIEPTDLQYEKRLFSHCNIQLDIILLGGETKYTELIDFSSDTGGHVYVIEDMDELSRLYYNIYYNKDFDKTDSDGDKLYDVVEKEGIRLKNGQIIYTRPYDEDTDGDNLLDGEEIVPEMVFGTTSFSLKKSSYRYYYNWNSDPTNIDTDGDGIQDDVDIMPMKKNYIEVAGLSNRQFVPVRYNDVTYYGGDQGWWKDESAKVKGYGCGIIAMCNLELYIDNPNAVYTYQEYKDYANERWKERYWLYGISGLGYTLPPWDMEAGIDEKLAEKNINATVEWGKAYYVPYIRLMFIAMLEHDIPIVASYHYENDRLECYSYDQNNCTMIISDDMGSHYFTITGIVNVYEGNRYVEYARISTWGKEYYIKLEDYFRRLSYFNHFLYVIY